MNDVKMRCAEPACPVDVFAARDSSETACPVCYIDAKVCGADQQPYAEPKVDTFYGEADTQAPSMPERWDWANVTFWDCFKEGAK